MSDQTKLLQMYYKEYILKTYTGESVDLGRCNLWLHAARFSKLGSNNNIHTNSRTCYRGVSKNKRRRMGELTKTPITSCIKSVGIAWSCRVVTAGNRSTKRVYKVQPFGLR